ncbi:MAG: response regulator [Bacteroidota bacterium]
MSQGKLLILDDDKNMARLLEVVLESHYDITIAHTIDSALTSFDQHSYDAVILDLNLNGEDGMNMITSIRARNKWLPVLVVSGKEKSGDRITCFQADVDDYLIKPFNPEELTLRLARNISRFKQIESR